MTDKLSRDIDFGSPKEWADLYDVYGPSTHTPDALQDLFSADPKRRGDAAFWLYSGPFHQGGRFEATVRLTPILFDMLEHKDCPSRAFLLQYVVAVALGYSEEHAPFGVDPAKHRAGLIQQKSRRDRGPRVEHYCDARTALEIFDLVQAERRRVLPFLEHADPATAISAQYAAAFLMADDETARSLVAERLEDPIDEVRWSAMIAWPLMERAIGIRDRLPAFEARLSAAEPRDRFLAALGACEPDSIHRLAEPLCRGIAQWRPIDVGRTPTAGASAPLRRTWNETWGSPVGSATTLIRAYVKTPTRAWVDALVGALAVKDAIGALTATRALLEFIAPRDPETGSIRRGAFDGVAPAALSDLQRRALEGVRDFAPWSPGGDGARFVNMMNLAQSFGLPDDPRALDVYLKA